MYNIFEDITSALALDYWMKHSVERQVSRRIAFQHKIELLSMLSPEWAKRRGAEQTQILLDHPFDDDGSVRARLTKELRDQGHSPDDARRFARETYPKPSH